jgi:predicted RNA-binding Zn ribbon-like protein
VRFEFIGGALCLDFANTIHDSHAEDNEDELRNIADLLQWASEAGLLSRAEHDRLSAHYARNSQAALAALSAGIATRDLVLATFSGVAGGRPVSPRGLSELNAALARALAFPRVHKQSGRIAMDWESAAGGLQRVQCAVLISAAQLLASDRVESLRECASGDCTWLFVDETRNHSRRWCDMRTCGNRMKARRHYRRSAKGPNHRHRPASKSTRRIRPS